MPRVAEPRDLDTRELRLTRRLLEKFGYAPDCEGCIAAQGDLPRRNHRASCRERMYKAISADAEERRLLETALSRMAAANVSAASRPGAPKPTDAGVESPAKPKNDPKMNFVTYSETQNRHGVPNMERLGPRFRRPAVGG